jgi:hypothetical protein
MKRSKVSGAGAAGNAAFQAPENPRKLLLPADSVTLTKEYGMRAIPPLDRYGTRAILSGAMKMTMHIDEDVLAQVMELTGAKTKTQAVEMALTEMARRHKQKKFFKEGLGLTPEQLGEIGRDLMEIHGDSMDIDEAAVQRFMARTKVLRAAKQAREQKVAEDQAPYRTGDEQS